MSWTGIPSVIQIIRGTFDAIASNIESAAKGGGTYMTVASYMNLQAAKNFMIRKLQKVNTFGTFLKTPDGYRVTAPEGFVAIRSGQALKLVDRLEFSRANFTADKNWEKGNPMPVPKI